jgi:hypothetical protein
MPKNVIELEWLCPISTVVKHFTHNPKVNGSDPTIVTGKEKMAINVIEFEWMCPISTLVEHLTHNPNVGGSNPSL